MHRRVLTHHSASWGRRLSAELAQEHRLSAGLAMKAWTTPALSWPSRGGCKKISNAQLLLKWHWNRFRGKFNIQNPARGRSRQKPVSKLWVKITRAALSLISTESSYPTMLAMLAMLAVLARGHPSSGPLSRTAASQNSWSRSRGAIPSVTNTIALPKPRPSQQTPFYKPGCLVKIGKGNATYTDCFKYPNKF